LRPCSKAHLLRAVGLRRADINQANGAGPGYVTGLLFTMAAAVTLLHQARSVPTEEELEAGANTRPLFGSA